MKVTEKIAVLRNLMQQDGIDYYYIPTNDFHGSEYVADYFKCREYMSGFTGSAGSLLVSATEAGLWTDGRYFLQAEAQLAGSGITLYRMGEPGVPKIFEYIAPKYHITLEEWNHDEDHVHIMFRAHPKSELSKFINAYKSASSRLIKKEYPEIRQKLWKEMFWSQSFCLLSAGGAPIEVIRQYIETQGEKKHERSIPVSDLSQ